METYEKSNIRRWILLLINVFLAFGTRIAVLAEGDTLGFKEGVMSVTDVMKAQTAWVKAQTEILDSDIDVKLSQITLNKALGLFK